MELNKSIQNIQPNTQWLKKNQKNIKECDKQKSNKSSKLHVTYISSNNVRR